MVLYAEGLSFRSIGRLLSCCHVAVYQRINQYGEQARLDALPTTELDAVEMDEMHSYAGSKKTSVGGGLPLTEQESDSSTRSSATAQPIQGNVSAKEQRITTSVT